MPPKKRGRKSKEDLSDYPKGCVFCYEEEDNEEVYGKLLRKSGITVHYFCMVRYLIYLLVV